MGIGGGGGRAETLLNVEQEKIPLPERRDTFQQILFSLASTEVPKKSWYC